MIANEYRNLYDGPDKYFRALDQMVADSDFVCSTEELAQTLAAEPLNYWARRHRELGAVAEDRAVTRHGGPPGRS